MNEQSVSAYSAANLATGQFPVCSLYFAQMTVWRQMATPKEDSSGKKSPSLRSTSKDQFGNCQSRVFCQAAESQHTEYLIWLGSISNSCHLINRMLGKEEQKTFQGLIRVSNVNDWMLRLIPRLFFFIPRKEIFPDCIFCILRSMPQVTDYLGSIMKFSKKILISFRLQWLNQIKFLKHRSCKTDVSQGLYSPS